MHLHAGETAADAATLGALLAEQVPDLAHQPIEPVAEQGTVHHVFRVGEHHVARLPRDSRWAAELGAEAAVLDRVRGALPVEVPEVVHAGTASDDFPHAWVLQRWIEGEPATPTDDVGLADALADLALALRALDPEGLPPAGRPPLADLDEPTREAVAQVTELDRDTLSAAWEAALEAPVWEGTRWTMHADLLPGNLLLREGHLAAVIDWGSAGAGDGVQDLIPAWTVLRGSARDRFVARLDQDEGAWLRARGLALHQAVMAIPYYRDSHPTFAAMNLGTAQELLVRHS